MKQIIFFLTSSLFLTACASSFYSSEKKEKNNSFTLKSNVSNLTIQFPNAKPKDTEFYNQELTINSGNTFTYPYLRKRLLTVLVSSGDESKTIKIKRKVRGGALFKSISLGLFTYAIPLLVDPFNPDFYKISKESKEFFVSFKNSTPPPSKTNENNTETITEKNNLQAATPSVSAEKSSSISKPSATENNVVTLTVSAQGKTKEEAKYNAFRDALERAYGTFISSNTLILNDSIIKDEIISVSNGNIQQFEVKSEIQLSDGTFTNVVKVTVSINKLINFCESKGIQVEFQGSLFAANIRLQKMNKENENKAIQNMYNIIEKLAIDGYDFTVEVKQPKESFYYSNAYDVQLIVRAKFNNNIVSALEIMEQTVSGLLLTKQEIETLKSQNTSMYPLKVGDVYGYLRSFSSVESLIHLCKEVIPYYSTTFSITNGLETSSFLDILSSKSSRYALSSDIKNNYRLFEHNERDGFRDVSNYIRSIRTTGTQMNTHYNLNFYDDYDDKYLINVRTDDVLITEILFPINNVLTLDEISKVNEFKVFKSKKQ